MKKFFNEFKEFAMKGNVMDMAVGIIIGAAFTAIVTSLVHDILSPIIGLLVRVDFNDLAVTVSGVDLGNNQFYHRSLCSFHTDKSHEQSNVNSQKTQRKSSCD